MILVKKLDLLVRDDNPMCWYACVVHVVIYITCRRVHIPAYRLYLDYSQRPLCINYPDLKTTLTRAPQSERPLQMLLISATGCLRPHVGPMAGWTGATSSTVTSIGLTSTSASTIATSTRGFVVEGSYLAKKPSPRLPTYASNFSLRPR